MLRRILPILLLAACVSAGDEQLAVSDDRGRVFARAYDQVMDLYIEPKPPAETAWPGLVKLAALDPDLALVRTEDAVLLKRGGLLVDRVQRPADADARGWGAATASLVRAAKSASPTIADTPDDKLDQTVFDGIVASLDKYSRYAPPSVAREQRASRDGFGGIGVQLDREDLTRITRVMPGTPAARAGLKAEDRLAAIDGVPIAEIARTEITRRLRGPIDTHVALRVSRRDAAGPIDVSLQRSFIVVPTVEEQREDDTLIFKISGFNHSTSQQLADHIAAARKEMGPRLRGLVLDMRGNPGGLLDQSVSVADLFVRSGPIVSTRGRNPASQQYFRAAPDDAAAGLPIVVLINGGSASAAEIVAAALQDTARAVVVGSASYGKGTVQTVLRLPNEGELTVTWAKLISPAGYSLNEHGVVPTVCTNGLGSSDGDIAKALKRGMEASLQRADLDETGWVALRKTCPGQNGEPREVEMRVAKRLLADRALYARALNPTPPSVARKAETPRAP